MGRIEKLVVLVVLFLVAVVVAVSLNEDQPREGDSPFAPGADIARSKGVPSAAPTVETPAAAGAEDRAPHAAPVERGLPRANRANRAEPKPEPRGTAADTERPNLLLDAGSSPEAQPTPSGPRRILRSTVGLRASMSDQYREYRVRAGDTWTALAQRFYHDARRAADLQVANEDLTELAEGQSILVPVYDLTEEAVDRPRLVPLERPASSTPRIAAPVERQSVGAVTPGSLYTVVDGDNLSKISNKVYGTPNRWKAIYEANRDTMESADWLQVGMRLRIPEIGALEAAAAPAGPTSRDPNVPRVR